MTKIDVIIPSKNKGWMYPLITWKDNFYKRDIDIDIKSNTDDYATSNPDVVILTSRYYRDNYDSNPEYLSNFENTLIEDVNKYKSVHTKVIFYDLSAASGSRELNVIKHVDLFLKRQVFKNRDIYKHGVEGVQRYRIWDSGKSKAISYFCSDEELQKIKVGWNLGYKDYRTPLFTFFGKSFIPFWRETEYTLPSSPKPITCSFRGSLSTGHGIQRSKGVEILKSLDNTRFITGPNLSKKDFYREMADSKVVYSPFGHGEICYRDIEAFIHGAVLVKPDVSHIETFPDLFKENNTYVPCNWDLSNLEELLLDIDKNYEDYQNIAFQGQNTFKKVLNDFDLFYNHFAGILKSL